MPKIGIRAKRDIQEVMLPSLLVAGDVTNWYQRHGFNTDPGWTMLVEVEAKVQKISVVQMDKIQVQSPWFQH
jgi:hypothetical protein